MVGHIDQFVVVAFANALSGTIGLHAHIVPCLARNTFPHNTVVLKLVLALLCTKEMQRVNVLRERTVFRTFAYADAIVNRLYVWAHTLVAAVSSNLLHLAFLTAREAHKLPITVRDTALSFLACLCASADEF